MRPIGCMLKRVSSAPESLEASGVPDVYSLSSRISPDFAEYTQYWRHNGYWLFDSPSIIRALANEHSIALDGLKLFFHEAHALQFDDILGQ